LLNFAHGDVFMVGSFIGFGALQLLGGSSSPNVPVWALLVLVTLAAMAGCAVLGVVIERFAYRPLRDAPRIAPLISALGVSFFLGSALAGAAGVLFAVRAPAQVSIGFVAGLKGFTAAVIGGIGSVPGAMAGGLILGFAESYTQGYWSTKWSDLVVFSLLILFMLFRPQGLLGRPDIRKV